MDLKKLSNVDINHGLDFEMTQERLNKKAGHLFRRYCEIKADPNRLGKELEEAREAYIEAQAHYLNIVP